MHLFKRRKGIGQEVDVRVFAGPREETRKAVMETLAALPLGPTVHFGEWEIDRATGYEEGRTLPREVGWWMFHPKAWAYLQVSPWRTLLRQPLGFAFGDHVSAQGSAQRSLLALKRSRYTTVVLTEPTLVKKDVWRYFTGKTVLIATEHFREVREALLEAEVTVLSLEAFAHELTHGLLPSSLESGTTYRFKEGQLVGAEDSIPN